MKATAEILPPMPVMPAIAPRPKVAEAPRTERPSERSEATPQPVLESRRAEAQLQLPQPKPRELPSLDPPKPAAAPVVVGAFANSATHTRALDQNREVQTAAFDVATARAPEVKLNASTVGAFDHVGTTDPRPGSDRPASTGIADAGFGTTISAPAQSPATGAIGNAGFGDSKINGGGKPRAPDAKPTAQVQQSGFANVTPAPPPTRATPRPERVDVSVEVLSKPAPAYTDEARSLKIEGEVLLEVDFRASGQVRVLRVVRGLGHGLDEAATRAAEQIQFKPARSRSGPVDFRAIVHITFRLT